MNIYKELKEIALLNEKIKELSNSLCEKIDLAGLHLETVELIKNCVEEEGHLYNSRGEKLDNCGLVDDEYYCHQTRGFIEDDYFGVLYYATDEEGTFVKVSFTSY